MWIDLVPTEEEFGACDSYDGDASKLGVVEKFFLAVGDVPRLGERLQSMHVMQQFPENHGDVRMKIDILLGGARELKNSKLLQTIMSSILMVGNYMNGSTSRGQAFGFKIEVLGKLANVKANDAKERERRESVHVRESTKRCDGAQLRIRTDAQERTRRDSL